jgi:SAM-dependent methyltransferase
MSEAQQHWDTVYRTKSDAGVSWYQKRPELSLRLILAAVPDRSTAIVDIGCGTSSLLADLHAAGYRELTGLDISVVAVDRERRRLGAAAGEMDWVVEEVTVWRPARRYGLWHDRAVFHFLIEPAAQDAYVGSLHAALEPAGKAVISTFAADGPERCSGLPVQRYSPASLAALLGAGFRLIDEAREEHITPAGLVQPFAYAVLEKR